MYSVTVSRIPSVNRSRARGLFAMLRASHVSARKAYYATIAAYGRPCLREFYWQLLPLQTKRLLVGLGQV